MSPDNSVRYEFKIHGMDCAEEVTALKREVGPLVGGPDRLAFDILNAKMTAISDGSVSSQKIIEAVAQAGLRSEPWQSAKDNDAEQSGWMRWRRTILTATSGVLLACGIITNVVLNGCRSAFDENEASSIPLVTRAFYAAAIVAGFWIVFGRMPGRTQTRTFRVCGYPLLSKR